MREQRERKLVLLVTKRRRQSLKERFVPAMTLRGSLKVRRLSLESKLRRAVEHASDPFLGQISERRLTTTGPRQRNARGKYLIEGIRIDAHLDNVAIGSRARKKCAFPGRHENVQNRVFECGIRGVTVRFPIAIDQVEFDTAANRVTAIQANRGFAEIRSRFTIPTAELRHLYIVAGGGLEVSPEIACKPTRLQFELGREAAWRE